MAESNPEQMRQWAVRGAEQRLLEIAAEAAAIYETFPELRDRSGNGLPARPARSSAAAAGRERSRMSAEARQAVSERMRKYWAARRAATGGSGDEAPEQSTATAKRGRPAGGRPGRRKMSPEARKRISDAQKKRWADRRRSNG